MNRVSRVAATIGKLFAAVLVILIVFALGFATGAWRGTTPPPTESGTTEGETAEKKPEVWTCSMDPQVRRSGPGLCPICGMDLVPVDADETTGLRRLATSPAAIALMDIETAVVERKFVTAQIRMVGKIDYDETRLADITAWVPGRLDRLYVDYTGVPVNKGDHLVYIYSPELLSAQEELLLALEAVRDLEDSDIGIVRERTAASVKASREKLELLGLTPEQIAGLEKSGKATDRITIHAPSSGIVIHRHAQQGMYVKTGTRIYTIADLNQVWVKLDAYESDLTWIRYGQQVEFTSVSYPGETFSGMISFIDPILNPATRTVKVRVNAPNAHGKLKPGMFVKAVVRASVARGGRVMDAHLAGKWICSMHPSVIKFDAGKCDICEMPLVRTESLGYVSDAEGESERPLVIPVSAPLITGRRAIVYVKLPGTRKPTFEGREIVLGPRAGNHYLVRSGLKEGERVVTRGNFKIDSALQLLAKPSMMTPGGGGHDHGGQAGAKPGKKAGGPAVEFSPLFRKQLQAALAAAHAVDEALEAEDLNRLRSAFAGLEKAVRAANAQLPDGDTRMLWTEYAMRLTNDGVEGKDAETLADAARVAESLAQNAASLRAKFGLAHAPAAAPARPASPAAFRKQILAVFDGYFATHGALAGDRFQEALAAAEDAAKALALVDMTLLKGDAHNTWMKYAPDLESILSSAAKAGDIQAARENFALLSEQMAAIAEQLGPPGGSPLYKLRCPMAFNDRGAIWLQRDEDTLNPYYGAAMLKCGSVQDVIEAHSETGRETDEHE